MCKKTYILCPCPHCNALRTAHSVELDTRTCGIYYEVCDETDGMNRSKAHLYGEDRVDVQAEVDAHIGNITFRSGKTWKEGDAVDETRKWTCEHSGVAFVEDGSDAASVTVFDELEKMMDQELIDHAMRMA